MRSGLQKLHFFTAILLSRGNLWWVFLVAKFIPEHVLV
jgi:hypothetical protein